MANISKRIPILAYALLLLLAASAFGEKVTDLKQNGAVNDFANVIDSSSRQRLEQTAASLLKVNRAAIVVATVKSLDGSDIDSYASTLFKQWRIGPKKNDQGVLILLAVKERKYRVEVGYGLEPILPDGKVGGFGRQMAPLLKQKQYGPALLQLSTQMGEVIAGPGKVSQAASSPVVHPAPSPTLAQSVDPWLRVIVGVVLVCLFILPVLAIVRSILMHTRYKDSKWIQMLPEFRANLSGGNWSGNSYDSSDSSSGGYSSSDSSSSSSDSGGSSGGGGASGDY
ncbi:MAG: hypothetical protein JWO13_3033 [Acidobacteriales bacterium]|nr:hypothetical protein [Terriglobales bacterium]